MCTATDRRRAHAGPGSPGGSVNAASRTPSTDTIRSKRIDSPLSSSMYSPSARVVRSTTRVVRACIPASSTYSTRTTVLHVRSEEHTSELQSRENLVCRLLLEKKKKRYESRT